jgi:hypothetical protein
VQRRGVSLRSASATAGLFRARKPTAIAVTDLDTRRPWRWRRYALSKRQYPLILPAADPWGLLSLEAEK